MPYSVTIGDLFREFANFADQKSFVDAYVEPVPEPPPVTSGAVLTHLLGIGGVTDTGFTYRARADRACTLQVEYSTHSDLSGSAISPGVAVVAGDDFTGGEAVAGLLPSTKYYYAVLVDGVRTESGPFPSFTTFPPAGQDASFSFVVASCQKRETDIVTGCWQAAANDLPLFQVHLGDFVYGDYKTLDTLRPAYQREYTGDQQTYVTRVMARAQVYDDHDYGDNNANGDLPSKALAKQVWREYVPAYPLANPAQGIWHSFRVGNCEFFMLDTRYQREGSRPSYPAPTIGTVAAQAGSGGTILVAPSDAPGMTTWYVRIQVAATGKTHMRRIVTFNFTTKTATLDIAVPGLAPGDRCYFKRASMLDMDMVPNGQVRWLIDGVNNSTARWKFICTSVMFNRTTPAGSFQDVWAGWDAQQMERSYLREHITAKNVVVFSGDRHFSAIDDGTNSDWPEQTSSSFHRVPLDPIGLWSHGSFKATPSYGLVDVDGVNHTLKLWVKNNSGGAAAGVTPLVITAV